MKQRVWIIALLALLPALMAARTRAEAGPVTYTELLSDVDDTTLLLVFDTGRDLERVRHLGNGGIFVETNDAVIDAENGVSPNFGLTSSDPITYSHVFVPLPPAQTFEMATLSISAFSVSGTPDLNAPPVDQVFQFLLGLGPIPDDPVLGDGTFLGYLVPGGPILETTFSVTSTDDTAIRVALADNRLDVAILPTGTGLLGLPDQIAVRSSLLSVTYLAPEPSSLAVLLPGFLALGLLRRRQSQPA